MNFYDILEEVEEGQAYNTFAGKDGKGNYLIGTISIDFLNDKFSQYNNVEEMKNATNSELLKLYFDWLKENELLD